MFNLLRRRKRAFPRVVEQYDIDELMGNHKKFNDFVYTPIHEALAELKARATNQYLEGQVAELLDHDIPSYLSTGQSKAVLFRQISTPNHEVRRFFSILDALDGLDPFLGEHQEDRFTTNNEYKYSWVNLIFNRKKDDEHFESSRIVDIQRWDGKRLCDIETLWGQNLIDFHHELFQTTYRALNPLYFQNISPWLNAHGKSAKNYYKPVMAWFLKHGILFENFMIGNGKEHSFTKEIFLPAFIDVYKITGFKPLIVNLLPTTIEGNKFWLCHPHSSQNYVEGRLKNMHASILTKP